MAESENIVAETAEKIFADLADAQTINQRQERRVESAAVAGADRSRPAAVLGAGRLRRLRRQPRRRFQRAERRRTFCGRRAAGRNHAGGMAAGAGENRLARWRDDGGAREPEGPHHAQCRRHACPAAPAACPLPRRQNISPCSPAAQGGLSIALVDAAKCRIEAGLNLGGDNSDTVTLDKVQPRHDQAGAERV